MAYLPEEAVWVEGIRRLETTDRAIGGEGGVMNQQGGELANRTAYLRERLDGLPEIPTSLQTTDPPTYHVVRVDVAEGGSGYALDDLVKAGSENVDL
ncbi:MAG: hypothetical protein LBF80_06510, partial [Spirochaetaceae bacterium]|nr:hypothetical protein [Spirochaetaceae bacterium]